MPFSTYDLKLTRELVARAYRVVADPGPSVDRVPMTDSDYDRLVEAALARVGPEADMWLFAYGSLIWNPACQSVEHRPAVVHGWHRSFCLKLVRYRGTAERPGLMMALDRGGLCRGLAYRIPRQDAAVALSSVMRREISMKPMANQPRWLTTLINGERRPALGFVINRNISTYVGRLSPEQSADLIATGCGHWGSCAEYLLNTVLKLEEHGIRDRNLWRLQALVAERLAVKNELVPENHTDRN